MSISVKQHFKRFNSLQNIEMTQAFEAVQADLSALRASITGITAQLDADAGVTDTDYAANNDPAALQVQS